jgi:serine/threonine protein phosphatase PrpC
MTRVPNVADGHAGDATRTLLLLGPDHPELRDLATGGLATPLAGAAVLVGAALSAGWMPKTVPAVEPNEDGVLAAVGPAGVLLAVADGHRGSAAAVAALRALAGRVPDLLGPDAGAIDGAVRAADFAAAAHAAVTDRGSGGVGPPPARTALSLVVVTGEAYFTVSYGDTVTAVVRHGRLQTLGVPREFLGPALPRDPLAGHPVERHRRRPGDVLVLVTDGVPDYLGRAFPAVVAEVMRVASSERDAMTAARALVSRAGVAGAGDNITAAVLLEARHRRRPLLEWRQLPKGRLAPAAEDYSDAPGSSHAAGTAPSPEMGEIISLAHSGNRRRCQLWECG